MVKQRMASADVAGEVSCLKSKVVGLRLANLYDLNAKTYVLKLSKSGSDGEKVFLLLESGTRFHTVQVMYDKPDAPSNFTLKLRKHLRTRRLEDVRQLGVDRVVDFVFGSGDNAHHLILEMYAQGNVVLTDSSYQVLTLLRSHRDDDKGLSIMAKHPYPMHAIRLRQPLLLETLKAALAAPGDAIAAAAAGVTAGGGLDAAANGTAAATAVDGENTDQLQAADDADLSTNETAAHAPAAAAVGTWGKKGKKGSKDSGPVLKTIISDLVPYGPAVAEHCCLSADLQPQHPVSQQPLTEQQVDELFAAVQQFEAWLASLDQGAVAEGYIAAQPAAGAKQQQGKQQAQHPKPAADQNGTSANSQQQQQQSREHHDRGAGLVYQDYNPLRIAQLSKAVEVLTFHTFDEALDEFYSKIQGQRVELAKLDAERAALSRLDKIRTDQGARATALEREAADSELRATLIEYNLEAVDAAIDAVNAAIATGMDWHELEVLIKEERRAGNPVAGSIHSLQLDQNKITLLLSNMLDDEEDDEAALTRPATKVQVDLTAYSNAAAHHASRKKQLSKQEKTVAAHTEALKAAEKKAEKQLANLRNNAATAQVVRKAAWFERFHWFISSENYLVISGRDAQQNELIVKRYFRKDDIYVHAELHGASSTIVRNHDPTRPVPPLTLQQAGCACVCRSRAWDSKVVTSAWWVYHSQVSKTAPTGEYLPTGSFMVRGKKQFLPPQGLVMGFGFMFKLEDSCIGRHAGERAVKGGLEDWEHQQQQQQQQGAASDDDQGGAGELESTASGAPSAALTSEASSTSALDSFLDMSADQLAAATRAASSSSTGRRTGFERYGLTHPAAAAAAVDDEGMQDGEAQQQGSTVQADSKRYISAAERAKLKKAAKPGNTAPPQQQQASQHHQQKGKAEGGSNKPAAGTGAAAAGADAGVSVPKVSRGKKGKAAKAKEKYAEQDDEDREMALQVLGSAGVKKTRQERRQQRKVAREEARQTRSGLTGAQGNQQEAIRKATASQFSDLTAATAVDGEQEGSAGSGQDSSSNSGEDTEPTQANGSAAAGATPAAEGLAVSIDAAGADTDADCVTATAGEHVDSSDRADSAAAEGGAGNTADGTAAAAADSDDNAEAVAAAADEAERAEISALLAEENIAEMVYEEGDAAAAALKELDSLTGCPRPDDVLMYAVPVCGPYAALANYKYKVKLTPGTLKKGKAVKQAVEVLVRGQDVLPRERELVRACPDADKINAMVGTVKISAAGLQQIKQASKKAKKAAAQSKAAI